MHGCQFGGFFSKFDGFKGIPYVKCWKQFGFVKKMKVGMGYTGLSMALLTVWEGSRQMRTFAGFVAVAGRSHTTMLETQGVGYFPAPVDPFE